MKRKVRLLFADKTGTKIVTLVGESRKELDVKILNEMRKNQGKIVGLASESDWKRIQLRAKKWRGAIHKKNRFGVLKKKAQLSEVV